MRGWKEWFIERHAHGISHKLAQSLFKLITSDDEIEREMGGYVVGEKIYLINRGKSGGVFMGHASHLRNLECDYTFHTHPKNTDVPYPSGLDVAATYMTGHPDLVVCNTGIFKVTPTTSMPWEDVERISGQIKQETGGDYWQWKEKCKSYFPVRIEKVYEF